MDHDAAHYDRQRIEFEGLWRTLRNKPLRVTDAWLRRATDGALVKYLKLWTLEFTLFDVRAAARRAERVSAEIERRKAVYERRVRSAMPGWGEDQRRLNVPLGRESS